MRKLSADNTLASNGKTGPKKMIREKWNRYKSSVLMQIFIVLQSETVCYSHVKLKLTIRDETICRWPVAVGFCGSCSSGNQGLALAVKMRCKPVPETACRLNVAREKSQLSFGTKLLKNGENTYSIELYKANETLSRSKLAT